MTCITKRVKNLFFPAKCVRCRRPMPSDSEAFCEKCLASWQAAYALRRTTGIHAPQGTDAVVCLASYHKGNPTGAVEKLIYHVKHKGSRQVMEFVVSCLAEELTVEGDAPVVTYPPRRRVAVIRDGFDQASRLARGLAKYVGGEYQTLFRRAYFGDHEQKRLDTGDRKRNADAAFLPTRHFDERVKGRTVILVDDLTTTGATLGTCTALLRRAGATHVIWATIAQNEMES